MPLHQSAKQFYANCTGVGRTVRKYPSILLWPLLVLGLVLGLGVWGVVRISQVEESSAKSRASSLALDTATWFGQQLSVAIAPVQLMSAMVKYDPQYDAVHSLFMGLAPALIEQDPLRTIKQLEYVPNGVIADVYPPESNNVIAEGFDLFNSTDRQGALKTIHDRALTLVGPLVLVEGGHGVIVRDPIFVSGVDANETFGLVQRLNPYCGAPCAYDAASRTKFWGFAAGVISLDTLSGAKDSKLRMLEELGYRYEVRALDTADDDLSLVAASDNPVSQPVEAPIRLPNTRWVVRVSPKAGWRPGNFGGMMAAVFLVAVALALLLFTALVSRKRHQMLLEALLPQHVIKDLRGTDATLLQGPRILQAETTADLMLSLLNRLLEGYMPDLRDVVFIRQAIIRSADLYQPTDLNKHIRNANLDIEVARALMQQLGGNAEAGSMYDVSTHPYRETEFQAARSGDSVTAAKGAMGQQAQDCSTLSGALALILSPLPAGWGDSADTAPGDTLPSEAVLLPGRDTEAGSVASPRHSAYNSIVRAMSTLREATAAGSVGAAFTAAPAVSVTPGGGPGSVNPAISGRRDASMELVHAEEKQRQAHPHYQQQQRRPQPLVDLLQRHTPRVTLRRSSLTFRDALQLRSSCDDAYAHVDRTPLPPPPHAGDGASAVIPTAPGVAIINGGGGGDSDGRLTPVSGSTITQEDNALTTGALLAVRRLPRRVASAVNILGRPRSSQRRSSLVMATNAVQADVILERRLAVAASAAAAVTGSAGAAAVTTTGVAAAASYNRRTSVRSVASVQEGLTLSCAPSELVGLGLGLGTVNGMDTTAAGGGGGGGSRMLVAALAGGGGSSSKRAQLGGLSRVVPLQRVQSIPPTPPPPPAPVIEEVERVLATADSWQFDMWRLRDVTNGHPLSALGFYLFHRAGLISHFNLNPTKLARLLRHIEAGYTDNPYHNATHAADVLQTLHVIIHGAQLHVHYVDQLGLLAAYFAAIVHDYGHPGLTNDFLIATSDPLAVRYNDRSPLENHHAAASFSLLQRSELDALASLSKSERASVRKQVIEMVLATDMKQHFALLSQFNTTHRLSGFAHEANAEIMMPTKSCPSSKPAATAHSELSEVVVNIDSGLLPSGHLAPKPLDDTERLLSLQMAIKAADLGHLGEELEVHQRWLSSLEEEFFRQGDKERQLGIPMSPLFDRAKQGVSKSQVGFYDFVALPLVHALTGAFPGTQPLMRAFLANYNHWRSVEGQAPVAIPGKGTAGAAPAPPPAAAQPTLPALSAVPSVVSMSVTAAPDSADLPAT